MDFGMFLDSGKWKLVSFTGFNFSYISIHIYLHNMIVDLLCLCAHHPKTVERICMKFDIEVTYTLD